jgi:hypothetical protein
VESLIDRYMPEWDVRERHRTRVNAAPERVYAAIRTADLAGSSLVRLLLALRGLPALLTRKGRAMAAARERRVVRLADFERHGFSVLEERAPADLLIGLEGRFWTPTGSLRPARAAGFSGVIPPGEARAAWDFRVEAEEAGGCTLSTETRVRCADAGTRLRFLAYWTLVRPGSGLIRRMMLRSIRRAAESPA